MNNTRDEQHRAITVVGSGEKFGFEIEQRIETFMSESFNLTREKQTIFGEICSAIDKTTSIGRLNCHPVIIELLNLLQIHRNDIDDIAGVLRKLSENVKDTIAQGVKNLEKAKLENTKLQSA